MTPESPDSRREDRFADLLDGRGDPQSRLNTAREVVANPVAREAMLDLLATDLAVARLDRPSRRPTLWLIGGALAALVLLSLLMWPSSGAIRVIGTATHRVAMVSSFVARPGQRLEVTGESFPSGALFVARPFDRAWAREARANEDGIVLVDDLVKKPGSYLIIATRGSAAEVDAWLDRLELPADLGARGLADATAAVVTAMDRVGPLRDAVVAVCAFEGG